MLDFLDDEETHFYMNAKLDGDEIIYIDSNILMNEKSTSFLFSLNESNKIVVPKEQYNELYKLKNSEDKDIAHKARQAFRNLEELYDKKIAVIENLENSSQQDSYADPIFIKCILKDIKNNNKVVFVTEDRDLRLRLKIAIDKNSSYSDYIKIYTLADITTQQSTRRIETSALEKNRKCNTCHIKDFG